MRKVVVPALLLAISLWAADFWQSKKFTEWSEKDVQKMLNNSPWAKPVSISSGMAEPQGTSGGKRGRQSGTMGEMGNPSAVPADPMGDISKSGIGRNAPNSTEPDGMMSSQTFLVRWESALPVREARLKAKYGSEAATSPESKKVLEANEPSYVITVSGLAASALRGDSETVKKQAMAGAELRVKGKDPIKASDFMLQRGSGGAVAVFAFPRSEGITPDDKEIEFVAKLDSAVVRQRFQLKTMMINGKLEL